MTSLYHSTVYLIHNIVLFVLFYFIFAFVFVQFSIDFRIYLFILLFYLSLLTYFPPLNTRASICLIHIINRFTHTHTHTQTQSCQKATHTHPGRVIAHTKTVWVRIDWWGGDEKRASIVDCRASIRAIKCAAVLVGGGAGFAKNSANSTSIKN